MESLYLIDNRQYLYIKRYDKNAYYIIYDNDPEIKNRRDVVTLSEVDDILYKYILSGKQVYEIAVSTLDGVKKGVRYYRKHHRNKVDRCVRIITEEYDELFRIPDGACVLLREKEQEILVRCHYLDAYHIKINNTVIHIKDFLNQNIDGSVMIYPEPEHISLNIVYRGSFGIVIIKRGEDGYFGIWIDRTFNKSVMLLNPSYCDTDRNVRERMMSQWDIQEDRFFVEKPQLAMFTLRMQMMIELFKKIYA